MNNYNWNAEDYELNSKAQQHWALELLEKLNPAVDESVLDLGCGDGKITAEIARRLPQGSILGVDSSSEMIALAQHRYPRIDFPNMSFSLGDARALKMDKQYDAVFSNAALHWVKNHEPVVQGLFRCLRPGGRILLQMGGAGNAADILSIADNISQSDKWRSFFDGFEFPYGFLGVDDYRQLLRSAGFMEKRVELIPKIMVHDGIAGLEGWIRTTWMPYTTRVPEYLREKFIGEVSTKYIRTVGEATNGEIRVNMVRIEVQAEKPLQ